MVHTRPDAISVVDPKHSLHDGEAPAPAPGLDRLFSQAQRVTVGGARDSLRRLVVYGFFAWLKTRIERLNGEPAAVPARSPPMREVDEDRDEDGGVDGAPISTPAASACSSV